MSPSDGDRQHGTAEDFRRLPQAREGLREDPDRDHDQRHPVRERRQYLGPLVAEALLGCLGPPGEPGREESYPEREVVREQVPRVREQREASGEQAADYLDDREARRQGERDRERPPIFAADRLVLVFVRHGSILPLRNLVRVYQPSRYWRSASQRPKAIWDAPRRRM